MFCLRSLFTACLLIVAASAFSAGVQPVADGTTEATAASAAAGPATSVGQADYAFRLCGNYCGPGWCNAAYIDESQCDDSSPIEGTSCADACCKMHDTCCGHEDRSGCNKRIVDCLNQCQSDDHSCKNAAGLGIAAGGIATGMSIVESWCCGSPC